MSVVPACRKSSVLHSLLFLLILFALPSFGWAQEALPRCETALDISVYPQFPNTDPPESGVYQGLTSILWDVEVVTVDPPACTFCTLCPSSHPTPARNNGTEPYMCYARTSFCPVGYERTGQFTCSITEDCRCADGLPDKVGEAGDPVFYESCNRPTLEECSDGQIVLAGTDACPAKTRELPCPTCLAGNPVDFSNGNKIEMVMDYRGSGDFPLIIQRDYSSQRRADGSYWNFSFTYGGIKSLEFPTYLTFPPPDQVPVIVRNVDNTVLQFTTSDNQTYQSDSDVVSHLERTADGWIYIDASDRTYTFDVFGQLVSVRQRGGLTHYYEFDGTTLTVSDDFGHQLQARFQSNEVSDVVLPDGSTISYGYDANGLIERVTYSDGSQETYHYEGELGQLTGVTNERGTRYSTFEYADSKATATEHAGGVDRFEFDYTQIGLWDATIVTNPLGKEVAYTFQYINGIAKQDTQDRRSGVYSPQSSRRYFYDNNGFVSEIRDYDGRTIYLENDQRGLVASRNEKNARTTTTQWHPLFRLPEVITAPRTEIRYTFDPFDNPNFTSRSVMDQETGEIRQWNYIYNRFGQPLSIDGPRTDVDDRVTFTYHDCDFGGSCGRLHTVTNALGHTTTYLAYDAHGHPTRVLDANGIATELVYDVRQRLIGSTFDGQATQYSYLPNGLLSRVTLADATYTNYDYDDAERLVAVTDSEGYRIEWQLDNAGNRTNERFLDATGKVTRDMGYAYDELSQMREMSWSHGGVEKYVRDKIGNLSSKTDAAGRITSYTYDHFYRLLSNVDAIGGRASFGYDIQDNLIRVSDAEDVVTEYDYSAFGDLRELTSADTGETQYSAYDAAGNLLMSIDARGVAVERRYDALNRVVEISYPDSTQNITYTYDQGVNAVGRLYRIADASGTTTYGYDARGNVTSVVHKIGGMSYQQNYVYNGADRLISKTYPSGRVVSYGYDSAGRVHQINSVGEEGTQILADAITHLPFGPVASLTLGNGIERVRTYDLDYRVENLTEGAVFERGFAYSSVNNITAITDGVDVDQNQLFVYDDLDRLEFATGDYGERTYEYDGIGNRLSIDRDGQNERYAYESTSHRLESVAGRDYQYDAAGNTLGSDASSFLYSDRNRLTSAASSGVTADYEHNALGQRVSKDTGGRLTHYLYDLGGLLIGEADGATGELLVEYAYLDTEPLAMWRDGPDDPLDENLAASGFASQSSTSHSGVASRAIDGNTSGVWRQRSVTHTASESQPWWEVELPDRALIERVVLYNRTDNCCTGRLSDVHVFVSEYPIGDVTLLEAQSHPGVWEAVLAGAQPGEIEIPISATGRYVRVQLAGTNPLSLAEVQVYGVEAPMPLTENLAPAGTASQSSVSHSGVASRAIDGNTSGVWRERSVTHTANELQPWWQVKLSERALIERVVLFNRTDNCCRARLSDVHVFVSETPIGDVTLSEAQNHPGVWEATLSGAQPSEIEIPASVTGRYVRVQLAGTNPLSLAEVQVYGIEAPMPLAQNLALAGTASQSSVSHSGVASRAIDGNTSGVWRQGSVTHTANQDQPWWEVELSEQSLIERVVLHNRTDSCCTARLSDVHVFVSESPMGDITLSEAQSHPGVWEASLTGAQPSEIEIPVSVMGRYVRVQLAGTNPLSLAEVEVHGAALSEGSVQ